MLITRQFHQIIVGEETLVAYHVKETPKVWDLLISSLVFMSGNKLTAIVVIIHITSIDGARPLFRPILVIGLLFSSAIFLEVIFEFTIISCVVLS